MSFVSKNHPQQVAKRGADDEVDDRGTHPDYFEPWAERFGGFDLDVAAAPHNAKCERFYTRADNGLVQPWGGARVWCNPPYSGLGDWLAKAWAEHPTTRGIVMLLPANRTEQGWWQEHVEPFRDRPRSPLSVEFLPGRMRFVRPDVVIGPKGDRPPFGCVLLIWADPRQLLMAIGSELSIYHRPGAVTPFEVECSTHGLVDSKGSRSTARSRGLRHLERNHE